MAKKQDKSEQRAGKILVQNRKANHLYHIIERIEAGIELKGSEVKSLRDGGGSIAEAYIVPKGEEIYVVGMTIPPYTKAAAFTEPSTRDRKLLLHRKEIDRLAGSVTQKGMTIVPLKVYLSERGLVKIEVGLARGKDAIDKRHDIKERDLKRELAREYKVR